jgi:hypothetical protein
MHTGYCGFDRKAASTASYSSAILAAVTCVGLSGCGTAQPPLSEAPLKQFEDFDRNKFKSSTNINNQWLPLKPGTRYVYTGSTLEGKKRVPRRLTATVTDLTKVIDGVHTLIVWDLDEKAGKLAETEIAFFAQDIEGNVWLMGEYPEEHENGKFVKAPAWIHGRQDARAGITMQVEPRLGSPSYSQGWAPAVEWTDRAKVDEMGQKTCVPAGCYEDVLVIAEGSKKEGPKAEQLKYYARGVGNVLVGWRGDEEKLQEKLELAEIIKLSPAALAKARTEARKLDRRAYKIAKDVYGQMPPAEPLRGAQSR